MLTMCHMGGDVLTEVPALGGCGSGNLLGQLGFSCLLRQCGGVAEQPPSPELPSPFPAARNSKTWKV